MPNPQTFFTVLALGKETSWGSSVARTAFLPIDNPRFQPKALRNVVDTGLRGKASQEFDLVAGPGEGTFSYSGNVYADTFGHLIQNTLGSDAVTGTATPFTHTFTQRPTAAAALSSHSLEWQNGIQSYLIAGARHSGLTLNFNATDGLLTYQAQGMGKLGTTTASTATTFTTVSAVPGWEATVSVNAGTPAALLEGSIQFTRGMRPVHGLGAAGTQDLADLVPLTIQVGMRLTFEFTGTTEYNYYQSNPIAKNAIVITWTDPAGKTLKFTSTSAGWRIVDLEANNNIYTAVAQINCLDNATDSGVCSMIATNSQSTAY